MLDAISFTERIDILKLKYPGKNIKTLKFIDNAEKIHGDKNNYFPTVFIKAIDTLTINCKKHGDFLQVARVHLRGSSCPKCAVEKQIKSPEKYYSEVKLVHNNLYTYPDETDYTDSRNEINIICSIHGKFKQQATVHLRGSGCPECKKYNISEKLSKSPEKYYSEVKLVHNNLYTYPDETDYIHSENTINIICSIHGKFKQIAASHLSGNGCPKCGIITNRKSNTKSPEKYYSEVKFVHNNSYTYPDETDYTHSESKINIKCNIHGNFSQIAKHHLNGHGCPKCANKLSLKLPETFFSEVNIVHNNYYTYPDETDYTHSESMINISCPIHGIFNQQAASHLRGSGCPNCANLLNISKNEIKIHEFIESLGIENIITGDRKILNGKELDIYLPDYNLAIEYNGLYWHSEVFRSHDYHLQKTIDCNKLGIQLIHIFEDEFVSKPEIVYSRLRNLLGKSTTKIYARKTKIVELNTAIAREFLDANHIQGFTSSKHYFGLAIYNPESGKYKLVSVMTFGLLRKNLGQQNKDGSFELVRFCNKLDTNVIGGASKLLKHFIMKHKPTELISYADKRWSKGNLYEKLGFELSHESKPNYFYVKGLKRMNRFSYRKDILVSKYGCNNNDTERNFMLNILGINRIYDCGTLAYKFTNIKKSI